MKPRDAWLLEKLDETRAKSKASAFGKEFRKKKFRPKEHPDLPSRIEFPEEVSV